MNSASAIDLIVPDNGTVAFQVGTTIAIRQKGTGQVTIAPFSGTVVINYPDGLKTINQYSVATLLKLDTDLWTAFGSLES
jgi:hypothetical protein